MNMIHLTAGADALCERVSRLIKQGRIEAARALLAAARKLSPPSAEMSQLAARIAMLDGDLDQAMTELDAAIAETPAHAGLRKLRAEIRQLKGDVEGAARDAAEAVMLNKGDIEAKAILGIAMLDLGRTRDAVACLTEAVAAAPAVLAYREVLATALEADSDQDGALLVLTDAIAFGPSILTLRNAAIALCMRRRDFTQAVRLAEQARLAGIADATTFAMKGHALSSLGNHEAATLAYHEALKLAPSDPGVRHIMMARGAIPTGPRASPDYVRVVFDNYADRFESHLVSLGYQTPARIRAILQAHPVVAAGGRLGPVLELGCGTGLVAVVLSDLAVGPITGVDLSPRMLDHARAKHLYAELREGDILTELAAETTQRWPMVIAADVMCYFGDVEEVLSAVHDRLEPGGWFVFSAETLLPHYDGAVPGNGSWALHRMGRYAHAPEYLQEAACAAGYRIVRIDRHSIRREGGADVPGVLLAIERLTQDG